jgi:arylformamidase
LPQPHQISRSFLFAIAILAIVITPCRLVQFAIPTGTATPTSSVTTTPTVITVTPSFTPTPTLTPTPSLTPTPAPVMRSYTDIPYRHLEGVDPNLLSLDIYTPISPGIYPVIVMIHGGGWKGGDKNTMAVSGTKSLFFTANNFIFISINYRLAPDFIYPAFAEDVAAALAWIVNNIPVYGGDPGRIYVMGHSAGGQLAALVATDERFLAVYGMTPGNIHGVILLDEAGLDIPGTMDTDSTFMFQTAFGTDPKVWAEASPTNHVAPEKGIPPFLVCFSGQNPTWNQAGEQFIMKLVTAGIQVRQIAALDKTHNSITEDIGNPSDSITQYILLFLREDIP